jgi:hypothetical protein
MNRRWLLKGFKFLVFAALAVGAIGLVVMGLWNWLAPDVFGGRTIGFWQAVGLFALARLLVGGLRGHGGRMHWRHRMAERWDSMSEEERARVRESMRHGCGRGHRRGAAEPAPPAQPAA